MCKQFNPETLIGNGPTSEIWTRTLWNCMRIVRSKHSKSSFSNYTNMQRSDYDFEKANSFKVKGIFQLKHLKKNCRLEVCYFTKNELHNRTLKKFVNCFEAGIKRGAASKALWKSDNKAYIFLLISYWLTNRNDHFTDGW